MGISINFNFTIKIILAQGKVCENITINHGPFTSVFTTQFLDIDYIFDIISLENEMLLFHAFYDTDRTEDDRDRIMYFDPKNQLVDSLVFF